MLTRRTNVLFDEEMYRQVRYLANTKGVTVGEYVRWLVKKDTRRLRRRVISGKRSILDIVRPCWKYLKNPKKPLDYRKLVEDGRRY